jgi:hypothetical protein
LGYLPVEKMVASYVKYKMKAITEMYKIKCTGALTIFEIRGLPELIAEYC